MVTGLCAFEMIQVYHTGVNLTCYLLLDDALRLASAQERDRGTNFLFNDPPSDFKFPSLVLNAKNKH